MDLQSICILGRLPALGCAELESLYGSAHIRRVGDDAAASDIPADAIAFGRLGGSIKLAKVLKTLSATDWHTIQDTLAVIALNEAQTVDEGKVQLGISAHGLRVNPRQLMAAGLTIKKSLRQHGYSVRLVPNQQIALNSAQTLHNHLTGDRGIELLAVRDGQQVIIARVTAVQDINAYAARDQGRPKRDAFVGMLPPKLAQTIVNLGAGQLAPAENAVLLDPFCGTGVVLQEALLMGYGAYGTDIEPRMIDYSRANLEWLATHSIHPDPQLEVGDATTHQWQPAPQFIACETYLGRPLSSWPRPETLRDIIATCNTIIEKFMRNLAGQLPSGTRGCLAIPAWLDPNGTIYHLPLLDHLSDLGYNRVSFEHVRDAELRYSRPDQIVARELLIITRK